MAQSSQERRQSTRYNLDLLRFWGMTGESALKIHDVSSGGMSLLMDRSYPRGSHLVFRRGEQRIEAVVLESETLDEEQARSASAGFRVRMRFVEQQRVEDLSDLREDS